MIFTLPKKTRTLWQLRILFVLAVLCVMFVVFCRISLWFLLPTMIVAAIGSALIFLYIPFYYKNYKISVDNDCVCINKGVVVKTTIIVPKPRLALTKGLTTPLMALLKLKVVMLKVTRGWLLTPEMLSEQAELLLSLIHDD